MENSVVTQSSNYFDLQGLDKLRQKAQTNSKGSIREVANQFEAMFASMLIKSMRKTNEAFETESPFNNDHTKFYTDMQDKQMALDISRHGALGLADALVRQLDPSSIATHQSVPSDQMLMPGTFKSIATSEMLMPGTHKSEMMEINKAIATMALNPPDKTQARVNPTSSFELAAAPTEPKNNGFSVQSNFIESVMPYANKVAKALGISPAVLVAQSALETGWGKKVINDSNAQSSFNLFNIKAHKGWQGDTVNKNSLEVENGVGVKRYSDFKAYGSVAESFDDYEKFITTNQRYQEALQQGTNGHRYIEALQKAGYATDPQYADKIKSIMNNEMFKAAILEGEING